LRLLKERRFNVVALTELLGKVEQQEEIPPKTVALTFDDGYRTTCELAQPILEKYGFPATVFLATDFIDGDRPFPWLPATEKENLLPMTWPQAKRLAAQGFEVGSHTARHAFLPSMTGTEIEKELAKSRRALVDRIGTEKSALSLPYSFPLDHSRWPLFRTHLVFAMKRNGYSCCCTLLRGQMSRIDGAVFLPRVAVMRNDVLLSFFVKAVGLYSHTAFLQGMYQKTLKRY